MDKIKLRLTRRALWSDVTCGEITLPTGQNLYTLERPWLNNEPFVSCIPDGEYTCARFNSPNHGPTFQVMGVPDRTLILFHVANFVHELQGCIALGDRRGVDSAIPCVWGSRLAIAQFENTLIGVDKFTLEIVSGVIEKFQ